MSFKVELTPRYDSYEIRNGLGEDSSLALPSLPSLEVASFFEVDLHIENCNLLPIADGTLDAGIFFSPYFIIPDSLKLKSKAANGSCILSGTFVAQDATINEKSTEISFGGETYLLSWEKVSFVATKSPLKAHLLDQSFTSEKMWSPYAFASLFLLLLLLFFSYKVFHKVTKFRREKKELLEKREHWHHLFSQEQRRSDFEEFYRLRNVWVSLMKILDNKNKEDHYRKHEKLIGTFFLTLNEIQYKKEWNEEDLKAIGLSFAPLKNLFSYETDKKGP